MLKRPLLMFLLYFAVVALSGVAVAVWGNATGDLDPNRVFSFGELKAGIVMFVVFAI